MVDLTSAQDVPPRVMELLRIFLAASSRGEEAVLTLETSKKAISTKYRSVESPAGVQAAPNNTTLPKNKKKNPARARRSRLRLEEYMKRKVNEKMQAESSLAAETLTSKLVIQLDKTEERQDRSDGADQTNPIPQVDGEGKNADDIVLYTFISDYHQDDIGYTLEELFPPGTASIVKCVAPRPRESADQHCVVEIRKTAGQDGVWPDMKEDQRVVFRELTVK